MKLKEYLKLVLVPVHLILILLEQKVISLKYHQYRASWSARLSLLYTVGWPTSSSHLDIPKFVNGLL